MSTRNTMHVSLRRSISAPMLFVKAAFLMIVSFDSTRIRSTNAAAWTTTGAVTSTIPTTTTTRTRRRRQRSGDVFERSRRGAFEHFAKDDVNGDDDDENDARSSSSGVDVERLKSSLLRAASVTGRGRWARPSEAAAAAETVARLERARPPASDAATETTTTTGTWELVLSDVEPFRASVFFLALASAVETGIRTDASDGALTVHSMATGGGEVGRVAHVIESNDDDDEGGRSSLSLHSLVELRSASLPSLPVVLTGTVVSSGDLTRVPRTNDDDDDDYYYELTLRNTTVQNNRLKYGLPTDGGLRPFENDPLSFVADRVVPSGDIFAQVLNPLRGGDGRKVDLTLTYLDEDLLIWRAPKLRDHFFCFARGRREDWPEMDELKKRRATASSSPIGSAFALGMLNPFFSRRAGVK